MNRSSHPEVFCKKGVLKNFAKFTGKHPCQSLFFNKVAGLRLQLKRLKKETLTQVFSCEFWKISKNSFSYRTPLVAASKICLYHSPNEGSYTLFAKWWFSSNLSEKKTRQIH